MASVLGSSSSVILLSRGQLSARLTLSSDNPRAVNPRLITTSRAAGMRGRMLRGATGDDPSVLRRPVVSPVVTDLEVEEVNLEPEREAEERTVEGEWVDWEDMILEETVPLVGFVRMILHSGKYEIDDRLSPDHEKIIMEKLLLYHPQSQEKIGSGIKYIKVGLHPEFEGSRCLFIVRKDGQTIDFSYWKCIKGLIRKKYPLYADSFILRHFRRRRSYE